MLQQREGNGWRIARDISKECFPILIGGESWAIELTNNEWMVLFSFVNDLINDYQKLSRQLMPQEKLTLEMERQPWWGKLEGEADQWSLQLILSGTESSHRSAEVFWPAPAAQEFALAMRKIWDLPY